MTLYFQDGAPTECGLEGIKAEEVYTLWMARMKGARVLVPVHGRNGKLLLLDIAYLDPVRTFGGIYPK